MRNREASTNAVAKQNEQAGYIYNSDLVEEMIWAIEGSGNADFALHGKTGAYQNLNVLEKA